MTRVAKPKSLTKTEYEILDRRELRDYYLTGERQAEVKLNKAFEQLWKLSKRSLMIELLDAERLVGQDYLYLFRQNNWIRYWKEAPPYMVVFNLEPGDIKPYRVR